MAIAQNPLLTAVNFQTDSFGLPGPQATFLAFCIYRSTILKLHNPEATFKQKYFLNYSS